MKTMIVVMMAIIMKEVKIVFAINLLLSSVNEIYGCVIPLQGVNEAENVNSADVIHHTINK